MQIILYFCTRFMQYLIFDDMTQCTEQAVKDLLPQMPSFRQEQALKYRHTFGQFCCLKSWHLLQTLLQPLLKNPPSSNNALLPSTFYLSPKFNEYGKPYYVEGPEFSISHCKTAIAVAINDTPIGIDVESIRRVEPSLIERTMNDEEQAEIASSVDKMRAFTRLWTMKEAYLKYIGTGIVDDLKVCLDDVEMNRFHVIEKEKYIISIYC